MLARIISIRDLGRFRNSASQPNPAFTARTFVYAPNGYGKSTLTALFRSLAKNDAAIMRGRKRLGAQNEPEADLRFDNANRRFVNGAWDAHEPLISVFDSAFVAENVHDGDQVEVDQRRGLYRVIIGSDGVALAQQELQLAEQARAKQAEVTAAERVVSAFLPSGMTQTTFLALPKVHDVETAIASHRALVASHEQAAALCARAGLSHLPAAHIEIGQLEVLTRSLSDVSHDAETRVRAHLEQHDMLRDGQRWISERLQEREDDSCPFCGRDGLRELELIKAYQAVFGAGYRQLRADVTNLHEVITTALGPQARGRIEAIAERNLGAAEFWKDHCAVDPAAFALPDGYLDQLQRACDALLHMVEQKAGAALESVVTEDQVQQAIASLADAALVVQEYNLAVDAANGWISAKKQELDGGNRAPVEAELRRLEGARRRHEPAVVTACDALAEAQRDKRDLETQKTAVRKQLETHARDAVAPYEARINHFLGRFNAGFRIVQTAFGYPGGAAASSYRLLIDNSHVDLGDQRTPASQPSFRNTLSAGDRTTLALAFFLAGIEREANLENRIIVFDDPFNSQDGFRRSQTIYEILRAAGACAQIIVLSHDPLFLKQLWEKSTPQVRTALQITYHSSIGSKITSFDIESACRGRAQSELDDLLAFRATGAGNLREVIKKLRIVLETYMRSTFTGAFAPADNLGDILSSIRDGGAEHPALPLYEDLDRINDYTAQYHHGEDPRGPEPTLDEQELSGYVGDTLRLVNALP